MEPPTTTQPTEIALEIHRATTALFYAERHLVEVARQHELLYTALDGLEAAAIAFIRARGRYVVNLSQAWIDSLDETEEE